MKYLLGFILMMFSALAAEANGDSFQKGKSVYIETPDKELTGEIAEAIKGWGYWNVASSASGADIVMKVEMKVSGGVTWTSWGGKSIALSAELKGGGDSWQSPFYKASPNGSNRYNSQRAAVRKLVGGLKKRFG